MCKGKRYCWNPQYHLLMQGGEVKYRAGHTCKKINTYNRDSSRFLLGLILHLTGTQREKETPRQLKYWIIGDTGFTADRGGQVVGMKCRAEHTQK